MTTPSLWLQVAHIGNVSYVTSVPFSTYPLVLKNAEGQVFQTGIVGELATEVTQDSGVFSSFYSIESAGFAVNAVTDVPPPDPGLQASFVDLNGQTRSYRVWYEIVLPEGFVPVSQSAGRGLAVSDYPFPALPEEPVDPDPRNKIFGTPGNDVLVGTAEADLIRGFAGNDLESGGAGDDEIGGGAGDDRLFGEAGNDVVYGGDGRDNISGADGNDLLRGGGRDDVVGGGSGDDDLYGGPGNDVLRGGAGNDQFYAGAGNDIIYAGGGGDLITGGGDLDTFFLKAEPGSSGGNADVPYNIILDYQEGELIVIEDSGMVESTATGGSTFIRNEGGTLIAVLQNYAGPVTIEMFVPPEPPTEPTDPMEPTEPMAPVV